MPRQARLDAPGTLHHVIIRGIEKRQIVDDDDDRDNFVTRLGRLAAETGTIIYAWTLMTNHAHILLRSSQLGLSGYMRRLLTGYAVTYNRRHQRHGHLFENRYKSIVCDEDTYFLELVRYIHLNPRRAKLAKDMEELDNYRWSGHGILMGRNRNNWQDRDYVLGFFSKKEKEAMQSYRKYVTEGVDAGSRPELVGGGLLRSQGGWSQVKSLRQHGEKSLFDDRILGDSDFVETILRETEERMKHQFSIREDKLKIEEIVRAICDEEGIKLKELQCGSRRHSIIRARKRIARQLVEERGVSLAEAARHLGVSTSAISKSLV